MMIPSHALARTLVRSPLAVALVGGLVMTAWDLTLDPMCVAAGLWEWRGGTPIGGIPVENYLSWWLGSSIVIGLFVYALVVTRMGHFSGWAGICALALLQVPIVVRTTENMLNLVPNSLREAAFALGTPKWKMVLSITVKSSYAGIVTGVLLAVARIAGETAPLLFTALSNQFWTSDLNKPMANLPVTIFRFAMSPFTEWQQLAWAGVFLITLGVLALNILARILFKKR